MDVPPTFLLGGLAGFTGVGNRGFLRHPWCKGFFASLLFPSFVNPQLFFFFFFSFSESRGEGKPQSLVCVREMGWGLLRLGRGWVWVGLGVEWRWGGGRGSGDWIVWRAAAEFV